MRWRRISPLWVRILAQGPRDPGDASRKSPSTLDVRNEVVAGERRIGDHPGEVLAEVGKDGHTRHDVRHGIQMMEAEGVHDVDEEIQKWGAEPSVEVIDE